MVGVTVQQNDAELGADYTNGCGYNIAVFLGSAMTVRMVAWETKYCFKV